MIESTAAESALLTLTLMVPILATFAAVLALRQAKKSNRSAIELTTIAALAAKNGGDSAQSSSLEKDVPRVFYYRNDDYILDLLNQAENSIEKLKAKEVERIAEGGASFGLRIFGFSPGLKGKKERKIREEFEVRENPAAALRSINDSITSARAIRRFNFSAGGSDIEDEAETAIKSVFGGISRRTGFSISQETAEVVKREYVSFRTAQQREDVSKVDGYIEITADFDVIKSESSGVELEFSVGAGTKDHTVIAIWCEHEWVQPIGRKAFSQGSRVRASVIGTSMNWDEDQRKLNIWPFAVYQ